MDDVFFKQIIDFFISKNYKIFVVGFGSEIFSIEHKVINVNLQQFSTLIGEKKCKLCISSLTGPPHLTYFFGNDNLKNIIIDIESARKNDVMKYHPLAMGDIFNYKKINTEFIMGIPDYNTVIDKINEFLLK